MGILKLIEYGEEARKGNAGGLGCPSRETKLVLKAGLPPGIEEDRAAGEKGFDCLEFGLENK